MARVAVVAVTSSIIAVALEAVLVWAAIELLDGRTEIPW